MLSLERRFQKDPTFKTLYCQAINSLLERKDAVIIGTMSESDLNVTPINTEFFLPHQGIGKAVSKDSSMALRIVMDGSAKNNDGISLNDCLNTGPTVHSSLIGVLIRFRLNSIALIADIEKMFLNLKIRDEDQNFQKFFWRENSNSPMKILKFTSCLFGLSDSP